VIITAGGILLDHHFFYLFVEKPLIWNDLFDWRAKFNIDLSF
jgi:hypothetical protein